MFIGLNIIYKSYIEMRIIKQFNEAISSKEIDIGKTVMN
jgi:hypothetical protein